MIQVGATVGKELYDEAQQRFTDLEAKNKELEAELAD